MPMIDVVVPDDVVFVEIGARLNLNEKGGDLAWISQTVPLADGDVGRLVLAQKLVRPRPVVTSSVPLTTTQCSER